MDFLKNLRISYINAVKACFDLEISAEDISINETRKEFAGDFTFVIFPLVKTLKKSPKDIGDTLGQYLIDHQEQVAAYETLQGFLNVTLTDRFWTEVFGHIMTSESYGNHPGTGQKVLVEFSSPNTNKPLHLGHIRNILLGWSCSKIMEACGYEVIKTQVINDRGIAICKSMLAWKKYGEGQTPQSSGVKGDHFVGQYYVLFEQKFVEEYKLWQSSESGQNILSQHCKKDQSPEDFYKEYKNIYFNEHSRLGSEAKKMLLDWENGQKDVLHIWEMMNGWVYEGFNSTYESLGVSFDSLYYESDTYLLGKKAVEVGIAKGVFYKEEDGSVWVDLTDAGMDKKIVLRSDGTSVYVTQDIGTAQKRYEDFGIDKMIYTVADEQDYHFKVLFEILKRLEEPYADGLYHLSYGMVNLPEGKMKSREGTVVDADDLISEVIREATSMSEERGELAMLNIEERKKILKQIGLGALKYFIIKVQPQKRMIFNPKESVDMQGQTGPYIQNAYVRIRSVLRKAGHSQLNNTFSYGTLEEQEKTLIRYLMQYPDIVLEAGRHYDPSAIANFSYQLAKDYHRFYHDIRILNAETEDARLFRVSLSQKTGEVLKHALDLLGIEMPERM
jgi:arginyl-tRNA synthetase